MLLDNWLAQRALTCPDRLAIASAERRLTYAELDAEASATARRLAAGGVRQGSAVAIELRACVEYAVLLHALMRLGAVAIPLDPRLSPREREAAFKAEPPSLVVSDIAQLPANQADLPLLGEHDLDSTHCRILTSGSAGAPHAVGLTYGNHLWSAVGSAFNLGMEPADRWLCCLPLHHVSGLAIVFRSVIYGTGAVIQDGFDPERIGRSLQEDGITLLSLVATQVSRLLEAGIDLSGPRAILVGGGPVPPDVLEEAHASGATVVQTYGLTEAASQVTTLAPEDAKRKRGSAGRPLLTTHLRIADGEILVQGPIVAPDAADADGWLHTGDLGRIDEEGFLYVEGRRDDMIVSGGENVVPAEVEAVLRRHPAVADVAVVARPSSEWQQAVAAVVVLEPGASADEADLRRHCAERLAPYKVPKGFEFAAELPRTASGKVRRFALRRGLRAPSGGKPDRATGT